MPSESATKRRTLVAWSVIGAFAFFAVLWALDYPKPMADDLFYTGAALNLAGGGDYSNPMLARQEFPSHFFFVYPPVHTYVLAGWLKVFGVSAASMTGFQMTMYFLTAVATIAILRKHGAPVWMEWLVPLGVNAAFFNDGLRTEPLAAAFLMTGFALVECVGRRSPVAFAGFLLLALGGLTAPRTMVFAATFALLIGWRLWRNPAFARRPLKIFALAASAVAVAGLVFLWLIDFRVGEFLHTFHYHSSGVVNRFGPGKIKLFRLFLSSQTSGQWLLMALPLLLLVGLAFQLPFDEPACFGLVLGGGILVTALMGGLYYGSAWYAILVLFFLSVSVWRKGPRLRAIALQTVLILAFLTANSSVLVEASSGLLGNVQTDLGPQANTVRAMASTPEHPLLVDAGVARYLYDYRLPRGCIDLEFGSRFPAFHATQNDLRAGDIYLVGPGSLMVLTMWTHLEHEAPEEFYAVQHRWKLFRHPREVYIIMAEECGGRRTARP
jgi:hypothetical protein